MSNSRHRPARVRSYSITHPPGSVSLPTAPDWDHIVFAHAGLFTARTASHTWAVPTHRALCVPSGVQVEIETARRVAIRCVYLRSELEVLEDRAMVITLTPLLRELVASAVRRAPMDLSEPADAALITLLGARLADEPRAPLHLPLPVDDQARRAANMMLSNPTVVLDEVCRDVHLSRRTIERRFRRDTEMTLGRWRRRARILAAVQMLANGEPVTRAAVRVGYSTPSSFVAAFRSELGATPSEFKP